MTFGSAFRAEENGEGGETQVNETQALLNAKISIADAIRAAEAETGGKTIDSGLNDENGIVSYQVEVLSQAGKQTDVFVALQTGKVINKMAADADKNDQQGEGDESRDSEGNDEGYDNSDSK